MVEIPFSDDSSEGDDEKDAEHNRQVEESEGFDVTAPMSRRMLGRHGPYPFDGTNENDKCVQYTKMAIDKYNQLLKDSYGELVFVDLLKVMEEMVAGFFYYLTFKAKNLREDREFIYQAVYLYGPHEKSAVSFRLKPVEGLKPDWPEWFFRGHTCHGNIEAVPIVKDKNDMLVKDKNGVQVDKSHPRSEELETLKDPKRLKEDENLDGA